MSQSLGWSISQWKDFTTSQPQDTVLSALQGLVSSFSKEDPAWITIASPELIASQWSALVKLGPNAKTVSKSHFRWIIVIVTTHSISPKKINKKGCDIEIASFDISLLSSNFLLISMLTLLRSSPYTAFHTQ